MKIIYNEKRFGIKSNLEYCEYLLTSFISNFRSRYIKKIYESIGILPIEEFKLILAYTEMRVLFMNIIREFHKSTRLTSQCFF